MSDNRRTHGGNMDWRRRWVPVLVWLTVVLILIWGFRFQGRQSSWVGVTRGRIVNVGVEHTGTIKRMAVQLLDPVTTGQCLATLDVDVLLGEIACARG